MLVVTGAVLLVTCVLVPPDRAYTRYFDVTFLVTFSAVIAIVRALQDEKFFDNAARRLIPLLRTQRLAVLGMVWITILGSMVMTNDLALLAFLPLAYLVLHQTGNERYLALTFVLQAAGANLGGMITPFGSPQNLYLYQHYGISLGKFVVLLAIPFALSVAAISALTLFVPREAIHMPQSDPLEPPARVTWWLIALLLLVIAVVLRVAPLWCVPLALVALLVTHRRAIWTMDYGLIATFAMFFVIVGNLARIPIVSDWLASAVDRDVLVSSVVSSQVISNVPTAVLFSNYTNDYSRLLVGVNVGGVGTIIASLASLIALAEFQRRRPGRGAEFFKVFTVINVGLLILLVVAAVGYFAIGLGN